jgi:hypothetical protein
VGDRLVFDLNLNPEKSCGVMCPKALLPVLVQISSIWEMEAEWADGGVGGVVYRIRLEKIDA